jgi:hypothetical protein
VLEWNLLGIVYMTFMALLLAGIFHLPIAAFLSIPPFSLSVSDIQWDVCVFSVCTIHFI